ncbi:hypothetical protein BJ508DRAFT_364658, partial [Ascobolus immersus RN42]
WLGESQGIQPGIYISTPLHLRFLTNFHNPHLLPDNQPHTRLTPLSTQWAPPQTTHPPPTLQQATPTPPTPPNKTLTTHRLSKAPHPKATTPPNHNQPTASLSPSITHSQDTLEPTFITSLDQPITLRTRSHNARRSRRDYWPECLPLWLVAAAWDACARVGPE